MLRRIIRLLPALAAAISLLGALVMALAYRAYMIGFCFLTAAALLYRLFRESKD